MPKGLSGVRADRGYSYKRLEQIAAYVREQLNFAPADAINALDLFEGLDDIAVQDRTRQPIPLRGGVIAIEDTEGFAKYDRGRHTIEILASAQTYDWLEEGYPRAGYLVAHELGHCVLHTDQLVRLAQMPVAQQAAFHRGGEGADHEPYRDTEWQANAFASALLMPARGLLALEQDYKELGATEVAEHFHVSTQAARYRLELYDERKRELLKGLPLQRTLDPAP